MSKKIAVIGECMIELSEKGAAVNRGFGGDTLNTSVYIARQTDASALGVHYVTALGTDTFSQQMLESWQSENVQTDLIQRMAILSPTSREKLLTLLRECRANGGKVIFDNNYRPRLWSSKEETQRVYQQMLACTDIAFLTLDDEDALWGEKPVAEVIARTHAAGVEEVVVKRGADSCLVAIAGQPLREVPAVKLPKEKVVDTTAAGDSFSAGYLAVRLTGGDAESAAKRGHLTASTVIQYRGAIIPREAMPQ